MAEEPKKEEETKGDEAESSGLAAPPPAAPMSLMGTRTTCASVRRGPSRVCCA